MRCLKILKNISKTPNLAASAIHRYNIGITYVSHDSEIRRCRQNPQACHFVTVNYLRNLCLAQTLDPPEAVLPLDLTETMRVQIGCCTARVHYFCLSTCCKPKRRRWSSLDRITAFVQEETTCNCICACTLSTELRCSLAKRKVIST